MIELDASHGGQMLRIGIALSCVLGKDVKIKNIRLNRPNPGLKSQHISAINALAKLCDAEVSGNELGSKEVTFKPGELEKKHLKIEVGTAGSCTLVLQSLFIPLIEAKSDATVRGGTDVPFSPPADFYKISLFPLLSRFGLNYMYEVRRRGYYPRGGGELFFMAKEPPKDICFEVSWEEAFGIAHATNLPGVAKRIKKAALQVLARVAGKIDYRIADEEIKDVRWKKGGAFVFGVPGAAYDMLARKGLRSEVIGKDVAKRFVDHFLGKEERLDPQTSDQVLPFVVVYGGKVKVFATGHVKSLLKVFDAFSLPYRFDGYTFEAPGVF